MDKRPTIIDVATLAGVSKSTVSLVLQNSPLVKADTRDDVRLAMAQLGYVYNRSAANLRSANAGLIGVVINDLRNPFFTEFATSLQMALSARGYATVIANTDEDPALQSQVVGAMLEHGVSALIVSPAYGDETAFDAIGRSNVPALQVLRQVVPNSRFPFAAPDYPTGSRLATEHLRQQGAKHIAFVGGHEGRTVTQARMSGYLATLADHGLAPLHLPGRPGRAFGREAARQLTEAHPTVDAVLCFNDLTALGLLTGCMELGRTVGTDLKVVGFDDIEDCATAFPALSSVRCDIAGFGRQMAETVLAWLENNQPPAPETITSVTLIPRASSLG
jgi:LacI family transcriptional regulator